MDDAKMMALVSQSQCEWGVVAESCPFCFFPLSLVRPRPPSTVLKQTAPVATVSEVTTRATYTTSYLVT